MVFRHEQTLAKPKADRLDLLRATTRPFWATFSCCTAIRAGEVDGLLEPKRSPIWKREDEYGVSHRVWKICDPQVIDQVRQDAGQEGW